MFKFWFISLLFIIIQGCSPQLCSCSASTCTSCLASFAYQQNNTCLACPIECAACSNIMICQSCRPSYYLYNNSCVLCPLNCKICSPVCSQCIDGYALEEDKCYPCSDSNALTCQTPTKVISCKEGYWQNGNSCSPCRQFCLFCTSSSNCFQCQSGYQVAVSFGSYCTSCAVGCKVCSSSGCTQCFYNFRLVNGACNHMGDNCSKISYCKQCQFINQSVVCHSCNYPYYLSNSQCIKGSSMLCQNGSIGPTYYQCLDSCLSLAYQIGVYKDGIICQPNSWINSNYQFYFNAYSILFKDYSQQYDRQRIVLSNSQGKIDFTIEMKPYYKLQFYFKIIALNAPNTNITFIYTLTDNNSNSQVKPFYQVPLANYQPFYQNFTTKTIKQQIVTISIMAVGNISFALSQVLVQIYSCPENCKLCYNKQLCFQCFQQYFNTPDYSCVTNCQGYIQLYLPDGDSNNYSSKSCVLECPSTFYTYQNGNDYRCIKCIGNCITCLSQSQCLSCISPLLYYQISYTCLQVCPNTHYSSKSNCVPCHAPCETCLNASTCLSCSVGYLNGDKCLSTCAVGTFQNQLNNTCSLCNYKCSSCMGSPTYCLSCNAPHLLQQSKCVTNCTFGLYYLSNSMCLPCLIPCRQCITQTDCLSCSLGYLHEAKCLSQCPNGYYADQFNAVCLICSNGCLNCLSSTICLSCPSSNLYSYSCYQVCPINTYSSMNICLNCLLPCGSCMNQSFCTSCGIGYLSIVTLGLCLNKCEDGYYAFELNRSCLACTHNCLTCSVASYLCQSCQANLLLQNSVCVTVCASGSFNLSGSCYSCSYPCLTCLSSDYFCTSCVNSYILINNTCQTQCPLNHYLSNSACLLCASPCETCFSSSGCYSCITDSSNQTFLYETTCVEICPSATFADYASLTCRVCIYPCQNCVSQQKCLSCAIGYLDRQNGICSVCPSSMYANESTKTCQKCSQSISNCMACLSATECIQCSNSFYLYNSSCIDSSTCLTFIYYYTNSLFQTCSKCVSPCRKCLNQSYCTSCTSGYLLAGSCLAYCPSGFYQSQSICYKCSSPCMTCKSTITCLSCNATSLYDTLLLINSSCIESWRCSDGFYIEQVFGSKTCTKCKLPCLTCSNATYCLSCSSGILINGNCKSLCPNMYYANNSNPNLAFCSQCSSNCFKCNKYADYCTSCKANQYLRNHTCVNTCGNGYYLDQAVLECFECLSPCGNCSSISQCLDCNNSTYILYYGQCLSSCPDGSYSNQSNCLSCPSSCLTCSVLLNKVVCNSCNFGLFMSAQSQGECLSNCSIVQYGDILTRNCYKCIDPCMSCLSAIRCLTCKPLYLLYQSQCLKISKCPFLSYLLNSSCINSCGGLWADQITASCISQCISPSLKVMLNNSKQCTNQCPSNYRVDTNYTCLSCFDGGCANLLSVQIVYKNIFNVLYLKLSFNKIIQTKNLKQNMVTIRLKSSNTYRLLYDGNISFGIRGRNLDAIWIQLHINDSLRSTSLSISFSDYYIFEEPLQSLSYGLIINSFDYYQVGERNNAISFKNIGEFMSIIMIILFMVNLFLNSGHLSYEIIDYYQLLFMVLFLSIDFTPQLNHFLYGFRYSHFLFLPQIFRTNSQNSLTTSTPNQFGAIVPDVNFINNTGQDLIIIFSTISLLLMCKLMQICFNNFNCFRSNKVRSEGQQEEQEQRWFVIVVKAIINRFKWNYFNDIIYSIYFSIVLFAFSQLYDLQWKQQASNLISILLAFVFLTLGIIFPFFLIWFLNKNQANLIQNSLQKQKETYITKRKMEQSIKKTQIQKQVSDHEQFLKQNSSIKQRQEQKQSQKQISNKDEQAKGRFQILTDYKCFVSGIKLKVRLGFYHIPIKYLKKLIFAAIITYCSEYPSFVLGVIMMFSFTNILITVVLKPYRLTFDHILYPIFDFLFILIFFIICIIQLPFLDLTKNQKLAASYAFIAICTLLSLLLAIHSIVLNIVQIIKYFYKIDYFSKYYQAQYISTSDDSDHFTEQGTNIPLKKENVEEQPPFTGSQIFSGLDIYLKKESNAPHYLIKCLKQNQYNQNQQSHSLQPIKNLLENDGEDHAIRDSTQGMIKTSTNKQISQSKKQMIQKIVNQIQTINLQDQQQQSQY